jgi:hypothetical protein
MAALNLDIKTHLGLTVTHLHPSSPLQAKLAAVASPNDALEGEECDSDGEPEPEGSAERIAFRAVVEEMEDLFFQQSAEKSGACPITASKVYRARDSLSVHASALGLFI